MAQTSSHLVDAQLYASRKDIKMLAGLQDVLFISTNPPFQTCAVVNLCLLAFFSKFITSSLPLSLYNMRSPLLAFVVLAATMGPSLTGAAPTCLDNLQRVSYTDHAADAPAVPIRYLIGLPKREPVPRLTRLTGLRGATISDTSGSGNAESGDSGDVSGGNITIDGGGGSISNTDSSMLSLSIFSAVSNTHAL